MEKQNMPRIPWPEWKIVRELGYGGNGTVFEIRRDNESSALKVISIPKGQKKLTEVQKQENLRNGVPPTESLFSEPWSMHQPERAPSGQQTTERFDSIKREVMKEYEVMADLKGCKNIVKCEDRKAIQHDDGFGWDVFIRMELLTPLTEWLGMVPTDDVVLRIAADLCNALVFLNQKGMVHRDVKPTNIFVAQDGTYKLGDFGITRSVEELKTSGVIGTYDYMPPEVLKGAQADAASDLYSLGMALYWMLNERRLPFCSSVHPGEEELECARDQRLRGVPIPEPLHGGPGLKSIVMKAISFAPAERYRSASELSAEVNHLIGGRIPKGLWLSLAAVGAIVALTLCIVLFLRGCEREKTTTQETAAPTVMVTDTTNEVKPVPATETSAPVTEIPVPETETPVPETATLAPETETPAPAVGSYDHLFSASVGTVIEFGSYQQKYYEAGTESIQWIVLENRKDKILVVSKYALDCQPYNRNSQEEDAGLWERSTLRQWLNGTVYGNAFTEEEQSMILKTAVSADANDEYRTYQGRETQDYVFLLSLNEVNKYFTDNYERICRPTEYTAVKKEYKLDYCWWWLRTVGSDTQRVAIVNTKGVADADGDLTHWPAGAVRPAMWIGKAAS